MKPDAASASESIGQQLQALEALDLEGLRSEWRRLYGPPPKLRSPELLRRLIAWRREAEAVPGLVVQLRQRLAQAKVSPKRMALRAGEVLYRDWLGQRHVVVVLDGGRLSYRDRTFDSLSAVAREITGARWNGPRFFGLRSER